MYMERPIIACNSGGPTESVNKEAGFLLSSNINSWAEKMYYIFKNPEQSNKMG